MKKLSMALILILFAVVAFVPRSYMSPLLYWSLFPMMALLLVLYWIGSFWVGEKDMTRIGEGESGYSVFCGKIPPRSEDDLTRGRMVIKDGRLRLYQRVVGKDRRKCPCRLVWEMEISRIKSIKFGKVLPGRKGFVICTADDEISFTSSKVVKNKQHLFEALGWNVQ